MEIKDAEIVDLQSILELQKLCYQENAKRYNDYNIPPLVQTLEELQDEFKSRVILKVEDNRAIIGSIRAYEEKGTCYIGKVIVHPDYQNRGIGKKLMKEIENRFPECTRFELFTGYQDAKNIYFYSQLGYKIFKEEALGDKVRLIFLEKTIKN